MRAAAFHHHERHFNEFLSHPSVIIGGVFETLMTAIEELSDVDPDVLNGPSLSAAVVELEQLISRLRAQAARLMLAWDQRGCWQADGAKSAAVWLRWRHPMTPGATSRKLRLARAVRDLTLTPAAWAGGEITEAHVDLLSRARTEATKEVFDNGGEEFLIAKAQELNYRSFTKTVAYWLEHADPDGARDKTKKQHEGRRCHVSKSFEGVHYGDFTLEAVPGAAFNDVLNSIERELYEDDRRIGNLRTLAQRRADALVEMAIRAAIPDKQGKRPGILLKVHIGWEHSMRRLCELADGTVITPRALLPWLTYAYVERIVFDTPSLVLDVGERRRLFTGATRTAVEARDEQCFHDTCDTTRAYCQTDHIQPYSQGGLTTQANGRMACGFHNRQRNDNYNDNKPPP
jgi:hypothetical protein